MLVIVDGPEKVGKSSLLHKVAAGAHEKVKWTGPANENWACYGKALEPWFEDARSYYWPWTTWDRSWVSEVVYSNLLGQNRPLAADPFIGEWLFGRLARSVGTTVILTPITGAKGLAGYRDSTDLPVDPAAELQAFIDYATEWGWAILERTYDEGWDEQNLFDLMYNDWLDKQFRRGISPTGFTGPMTGEYMFVVPESSIDAGFRIPATTKPYETLARDLGATGINKVGWCVPSRLQPQLLDNFKTIVTITKSCATWVRYYTDLGGDRVINLPAPHLIDGSEWSELVANILKSQNKKGTTE